MIRETYFMSHWWGATHSRGHYQVMTWFSTDCPPFESRLYKQAADAGLGVERIMIAKSLGFLIKSVNGLWQCLKHYASHVMSHEPFLPDSSRHPEWFSAVSFKSWQWGSLDVWDLESVMHNSYAAVQLDSQQSTMLPQKTNRILWTR